MISILCARDSSVELIQTQRSCAQCGAFPSDTVELKRCNRCLSTWYCNEKCQRKNFKIHKKTCKTSSFRMPKLYAMDASVNSGFRQIGVIEPNNAMCCCWCCAMLLKSCNPDGSNPFSDKDGPFWTETYGYAEDSSYDRPFPALHVTNARSNIKINKSGQGAACLYCAHALRKGGESHILQCESWLRNDACMMKQNNDSFNRIERRNLALVDLDQTPNLESGASSIAGYLRREFSKNIKNKKKAVPFNYKSIEKKAFPGFFNGASDFNGEGIEELQHYTMMRLYSVDNIWRYDSDYVVFSLHRLAAYGNAFIYEKIQNLPKPLPLERYDDLELIDLSFKSFD